MDELKEYIRKCRGLGFSDREIRLNLERNCYPKSLVRKVFFSLDAQRRIETAMLFGILLTLAIGIVMLGPSRTGYVTYQNVSQYSEVVSWNSSMNSTYEWLPGHSGLLSSLRLSGRIAGKGHADIYLNAGGRRYLVASLPESGISGITGHVIDVPGEVNLSANITDILEPPQSNGTIPDTTIEPALQSTDPEIDVGGLNVNATDNMTDISEEYPANISESANISSNITGDIKSDIAGNISSNISYNLGNISANATLPENMTLPAQNTTAANASVNPVPENGTSGNITLPAMPENVTQNITEATELFSEFAGECIDTCTLPELNYSGYTIEIVGENVTLFIDRISYSVTDYIELLNQSTNLTGNMTGNISNLTANVTLNITQNITQNLTQNITAGNVTIDSAGNYTSMNHTGIEINRPVRWTSYVIPGRKLVMPRHAYNITAGDNSKSMIIARNINITVEEYNLFRETEILDREMKKVQSPVDSANAEKAYAAMLELDRKLGKGNNRTKAIETGETVTLVLESTTGSALGSSNISSNVSNASVSYNESLDAVLVEYYTPAPEVSEEKLGRYRKLVTVSSEEGLHYDNILAYSALEDEARAQDITVYWVNKGGQRLPVQQAWYRDTNNNGLVDRVEWIVPHLSNETYEISITVLNVQSYPIVGDMWTVAFTTTGTSDLTIEAVNGTVYGADLEFVSLKCDDSVIEGAWDSSNSRVFVNGYSCNGTGYHTVKVLTKGVHNQLFTFGGAQAYAHNLAGLLPKTMNIQGKLTNSTNGLVNTTVSMTFRLYDVFTGGAALWTETQTVNVSNGIYDAILGNTNAITLNFSKPYYLGIQVGADSEMVPRINMTSSPYTFNAFIAQEALNITCFNCITGTQVDESTLTGVNAATLDSIDSTGFCQSDGTGCPVAAQANPSPWTNNSIEIYPNSGYPNKMNITEIRLNGSLIVRDGTTLIIRG